MEKNELSKNNFGAKGWLLVLYCFLAYFITTGSVDTMNLSYSIFSSMYGWNETLLLSLSSIGGYVSVVAIYLFGILYATGKLKLKATLLISGIVFAVGISLWGVISGIKLFVLNYVIVAAFVALWTTFASNTLCTNWFPRKKGLVVGWTTIGLPLGAGIAVLLFSFMLNAFGFRMSYFIFGIAGVVICLFGFFCFSEYPEQTGYYPDNDKTLTREQADALLEEGQEEAENSPWTTVRMLRVPEVWFISISTGYLLLFAGGSMAQLIPRLVSAGYDANNAVYMMTVAALVGCVGSYICGWIDSKVGPKRAVIIVCALAIIACFLNIIPNIVCVMISLAFIGMVLGGGANFLMSTCATYWGRYHFKKAYGTLLTINTLVGSAGAALIAVIAARSSYTVSYIVMAILAVVAIILMVPVKDGFTERWEKKFAEKSNS